MERKPSKHARTRSTGGVLASFLRSISSSSSSTTTSAARGKSSFNHRNAFSGPMVSIVPPEARGAGGGGGRRRGRWQGGGHRTPEPSSPKVSCIGQIKRSKSNKSKKCKARMMAAMKVPVACGTDGGACPLPPRPPVAASRPKGSPSSLVKRMQIFRRSKSRSSSSKSSGKPGCSASVAAAPAPPVAGLGQMKRFTSGRGAFEDFDWTADQTERRGSDFDGGDDGYDSYEDDGFVAHSAPLVLGGGMVASEPRKEVNLWRRRPMSPPTPLQLP